MDALKYPPPEDDTPRRATTDDDCDRQREDLFDLDAYQAELDRLTAVAW